jgi:hypothetical protein
MGAPLREFQLHWYRKYHYRIPPGLTHPAERDVHSCSAMPGQNDPAGL